MLDRHTINLLERLVIAEEEQAKQSKEIDESLMLIYNMLKGILEEINTSSIDIETNLQGINDALNTEIKVDANCSGEMYVGK